MDKTIRAVALPVVVRYLTVGNHHVCPSALRMYASDTSGRYPMNMKSSLDTTLSNFIARETIMPSVLCPPTTLVTKATRV